MFMLSTTSHNLNLFNHTYNFQANMYNSSDIPFGYCFNQRLTPRTVHTVTAFASGSDKLEKHEKTFYVNT